MCRIDTISLCAKMDRFSLISLILFGIVVLIMLLVIYIKKFPIVTSCLLSIFIATLLYVCTERWMVTHAAAEFENRFWTLTAFLLLVTLAFAPDSPITLGLDNSACVSFSWVVVIALTFAAHNYDRYLVRNKLKKLPNMIRRNMSADFDIEVKEAAKEKLRKLQELSNHIDGVWLSSAFLNIFWLANVLMIEKQIIEVFQNLDSKQINYILNDFPIAHLFYKVKDHWFVRDLHRTQLLELLTVERLGELNVKSRVMLIHGLQLKKLSANARSEFYAKNILVRTTGDQLSELKCLTDSKGDFNNMHKLMYQDIRSASIRKEILQHIAKQASIQKAHCSVGTRHGRKRMQLYAWRKIISDVDDTLVCSGGSFPAGLDCAYPKKELYPGVIGFLRELDLGITTHSSDRKYSSTSKKNVIAGGIRPSIEEQSHGIDYVWEDDRLSNLVFLSARPHVYSDISEQMTYGKFETLRKTRGLHGNPTLLAGSLDTGAQFIMANDMEPLAVTKYRNYAEYCAIYPEFSNVFIGDNGQGDVRVSEMILNGEGEEAMLESVGGRGRSVVTPMLRDSLERVYIHEIQPLHKTHVKDKSILDKKRIGRVCYFNNYIDAALDAYRHGLIKCSGLKNVIEEAKMDFRQITRQDWSTAGRKAGQGGGGRLRDENLRDLNRAIHAANPALIAEGFAPSLPLFFEPKFARGDVVKTPYGYGIVELFRSETGFYSVSIPTHVDFPEDWCKKCEASCHSKGFHPMEGVIVTFMRVVLQGILLGTVKSSGKVIQSVLMTSSKFSSAGKWQSPRTLQAFSGNLSNSQLLNFVVWTPYGLAVVVDVRPKDFLIVCKTKWGACCYLQYDKVVLISAPPPVTLAKKTVRTPSATMSTLSANDSAVAAEISHSSETALSTSSSAFPIYNWFFRKKPASTQENYHRMRGLLEGMQVQTPLGEAVIRRFIDRSGDCGSGKSASVLIIEVDFINWVATGYLQADSITVCSGNPEVSPAVTDGEPVLAQKLTFTPVGNHANSNSVSDAVPAANTASVSVLPFSLGTPLNYFLRLITPRAKVVSGGDDVFNSSELDMCTEDTRSIQSDIYSIDALMDHSLKSSAPASVAYLCKLGSVFIGAGGVMSVLSQVSGSVLDTYISNYISMHQDPSSNRGYCIGDFVVCPPFGECGIVGLRLDVYIPCDQTDDCEGEGRSLSETESGRGSFSLYGSCFAVNKFKCTAMYELRKVSANSMVCYDRAMTIFASDTNICTCVRAWPGQKVSTPYGLAVVMEVRPSGFHVVRSISIHSVVMYLHPSNVELIS